MDRGVIDMRTKHSSISVIQGEDTDRGRDYTQAHRREDVREGAGRHVPGGESRAAVQYWMSLAQCYKRSSRLWIGNNQVETKGKVLKALEDNMLVMEKKVDCQPPLRVQVRESRGYVPTLVDMGVSVSDVDKSVRGEDSGLDQPDPRGGRYGLGQGSDILVQTWASGCRRNTNR
ncbi:hypothetical protein AYO20_10954 [Fonsecaea nubica]|uniref:Uncharacterized protein n=1 Tax=Fonsecaea nubica TaxID=856822 RepID=A0A178C2L5_9EURO|nr:hypothetical protein AYO20_10954 [Fonsecaea nubica]OAL23704.1 hypothetical protein AYO20_10954 [Fonsecaea nubica]